MKKQITLLALVVALFTGASLRATETTPAVVPPAIEIVPAVVPAVVSAPVDVTVVPPAADPKDATTVTPVPAKTSIIPSFSAITGWCGNHKFVVTGVAAVVGFAVLWKTCPAFRALLGVEDEQQAETKFVY